MTYGLNMGLPVSAQLKYWGIATAVLFGALWFLGDILMPVSYTHLTLPTT